MTDDHEEITELYNQEHKKLRNEIDVIRESE